MMRKELTIKQKAFCDYYIEFGNATEAAKRAGYSEKTAFRIGQENIHKPALSQYIHSRLDKIEDARVAKGDEVLRFFSSVMRGEVKDQFGLDSQLSDRIDAAKQLQKRYGLDSRADEQKLKLKKLQAEIDTLNNRDKQPDKPDVSQYVNAIKSGVKGIWSDG